ncbi:aminopeptidase P family protein [Streptomyces sp. NPDC052071]|uniref:Aminopeptidase P family protein n=1 Tax=[Kitasatospora] papulosa TaxID=1464011 RepID=A0ABZ1KCQ4_9ACTN|nr:MULTISPECIES: aminopeptidase P family protein [Streptomyces]RAS29331.1 Xaa-Pro aminopeptidase [Streptomyces avidinii]TPN27554.1 aminopeptidase P family protein [Mesorhizobium sp. B2-3-3]SNX78274.1 Xaa-Pro aminopeptidase [Streptomyces microflavus]MDF6065421.1 aminopeptidase P family protein [Streptomyces sp. JH010]MDX3179814.1 aminopeptidase P family protein [Streptomyces sp. ME02-7008A-1]
MPSTDHPVPFTADDYRARMTRAAEAADAAGLAGVLVAPGPDMVHLTGYRPTADTERLTLLVLRAGHDPVLVVPALEAADAERATGSPALTLRDWTDAANPYTLAAGLLDAKGRFGISDNAWALHLLALHKLLPDTSYASLTEALPMLRAVKDAAELERLAAAGAAADATYERILEVRFSGRRESDVAADLAALLLEHGHSQVDFTVVGSGPNGADPHHEAGDRTIEQGDMVVLDFGGLKHGYGSDTSRTVHVGEPTAEEQRVHDVVREAQEAGCRAVRPGAACQDVDRAARAVITEFGYGERFIHRTGHGIGVTTHEPPYMIEGEEQPLVPGMCFSVEPGIYLPGRFGVRIEDIVTVTASGGRRLNTTARELAVVE